MICAVRFMTTPATERDTTVVPITIVGRVCPMVSLTTAEVLVAALTSPEYTAVMELLPWGRSVTVNVALPQRTGGRLGVRLLITWAVPSKVAPLKKLTLPLGPMPLVPPVTVTLKVTACESPAVLAELVSVVVVAGGSGAAGGNVAVAVTLTVVALDSDVALAASPL